MYKKTSIQVVDRMMIPGTVQFIFSVKTWINNIGKSFGPKLIIQAMEILSKDRV